MIRLFDLFLASVALLILAPLLMVVCLILVVTGEGEVIYRQQRVGMGGQLFSLYKFATMLKDSSKMENGNITIKNDPRVLPFGKLLRVTKINELPQLWNILKGDISVIGHRPLTSDNFDRYPEDHRRIIEKSKPGLSGIGSIVFRDEESLLTLFSDPINGYSKYIAPYKANLEVWALTKKGVIFYFLLIFLTIWVVLLPRSKLHWKIFDSIPQPPTEIKAKLGYEDS